MTPLDDLLAAAEAVLLLTDRNTDEHNRLRTALAAARASTPAPSADPLSAAFMDDFTAQVDKLIALAQDYACDQSSTAEINYAIEFLPKQRAHVIAKFGTALRLWAELSSPAPSAEREVAIETWRERIGKAIVGVVGSMQFEGRGFDIRSGTLRDLLVEAVALMRAPVDGAKEGGS